MKWGSLRGACALALGLWIAMAAGCPQYESLTLQDVDLTPLTEGVIAADLDDLAKRLPGWDPVVAGGAQRTGGPSTDGSLVWLRDEQTGIEDDAISWRILSHVKLYPSSGTAIASFRWSCQNHAQGIPKRAMRYISQGPTQYCASPVVLHKPPPFGGSVGDEPYSSFLSVRRGRLLVLLIETRSAAGTSKDPIIRQIGAALSSEGDGP